MSEHPLELREKTPDNTKRRQRGHYKRVVVKDMGEGAPTKEVRIYGESGRRQSSWDVRTTRQTWRRGMAPSHYMHLSCSQEDGTTLQNWASEQGMSVSVLLAYLCHLYRNKMFVVMPDGFALEDIYDHLFAEAMERRLLSIEKDIRKRFKGLEDEVRADWMTFRE